MKVCCFCWDVRSGTIASAVFIIVTRTLAVVLFSTILGLRLNDRNNYRLINQNFLGDYEILNENVPWYYEINFSNVRLITTIIVSCLHLLFSTLLLIGVRKKNKSLFSPWIFIIAIEICAGIGFILITMIMANILQAFPKLASVMIGILLQCYMMNCVICYYKQLAARENTLYNAIPLNNPSNPYEATNAAVFHNYPELYPTKPILPENQYPTNDNHILLPPYDGKKF